MDFATGPLRSLLSKLGQLLQDEFKLQKGVKKDIQFVTRELESMHAALRDIGEVPQDQLKEVVKIWGRDVRELSYDLEDIVDTFLVRVQSSEPPSKRSIKRFIKKMTGMMRKAKTRHDIGQEIMDIKERLKDVAERRDRYKVDAITPSITSVDPRITALYAKAASLVGIDDPREELLSMLTKEDGSMPSAGQRIVSIVGFGGLGKTTLAKAVYDKIKVQFNCTAFVSVSRDPDITKVLKDIIYELDKKEFRDIHNTALGLQHLTDLIHEFLKNKRYLIVIDDTWDTEPWEIIRCALPENGLNSRIITTTRIIDVAQHVGGCYKIKPLTHHNSKLLFYGRIFGNENNCPRPFTEVSEKILKKCGGIPLAIITISSLLANKSRNINEWLDVCDSIGSGLGNNPGIDNMRKILLLSYYDLTPQLKTCLLYLSTFPEDYKIERYRLIWRWVAEGFVEREEWRQSLFETGQSYFNELVNRSLIQPADMDEDDKSPFRCRLHDMVLDIICSIKIEENFTNTITVDREQIMSSLESKARRLSIYNTTWPTINMSKLRSLTINSSAIMNSVPPISRFHLLRVLDLEDCSLINLQSLDPVNKLFHLRYLSLAGTGYSGEVPRDIGNLQFLQALDFSGTDMKELPLSILRLRQLMYLNVAGKSTRPPKGGRNSTRLPNGLNSLSSLESLVLQVYSSHIAEEIGHLTQLKFLHIHLRKDNEGRFDGSMCKVLVGSLSNLHKIQTLAIFSDDVEVDLEGSVDNLWNLSHLAIYGTSWVPTWLDPASFLLLSHLYIEVGHVRREDIQVLGMLQALRSLIVKVMTGTKQVFIRFMITADAFPCVTRCKFTRFSMLPSMFPPGAMPRLQHFKFCIQPQDFGDDEFIVDDLAFSHLPSIQTLRVGLYAKKRMSEEARMKVEEVLRKEAHAHPNHPDIYIRTCTDDPWIKLCR